MSELRDPALRRDRTAETEETPRIRSIQRSGRPGPPPAPPGVLLACRKIMNLERFVIGLDELLFEGAAG
jgi:hypothetical protein